MGGRVTGCLSRNYVASITLLLLQKTTILFVLFIYRHVEYTNPANKELEMVKGVFIIFDGVRRLVSPASKLGAQSFFCTCCTEMKRFTLKKLQFDF